MKKYIVIILLFIAFYTSVHSQSYSWISSYYISYTEISVEFVRYVPINSFSYGNIISMKESQEESAFQEVSQVYRQMNNLQMLNKINRYRLNDYRDKNFKKITDWASTADLSYPPAKNWVIDNLTVPLKDKYISNEIKILNALGKEIDFIEHQAYKFSKEQFGDIDSKKKNIAGFLEEYENANPVNTESLLKKYNLYLMMGIEFLNFRPD